METYIKQSSSDPKNLIIHGHHLIQGSRILILEKLASKELYQILISSCTDKITSVTYFKTKFIANNLDWIFYITTSDNLQCISAFFSV